LTSAAVGDVPKLIDAAPKEAGRESCNESSVFVPEDVSLDESESSKSFSIPESFNALDFSFVLETVSILTFPSTLTEHQKNARSIFLKSWPK
jgi:hypothetical protein